MPIIKARGHEINYSPIIGSFMRKATQLQNKIITTIRRLGIHVDDIETSEERIPFKRAKAWVTWYTEQDHCHFSHNGQKTYIDNLQIIAKVLEREINEIEKGEKSLKQFYQDFAEDAKIDDQRKEARETLGLDEECNDLEKINQAYKSLARKYHPDMSTGDGEKFKKVNEAHKLLKREVG